MLDLEGLVLSEDEAELLQQPQVGGLILFGRNFRSPAQLDELMQQIREVRPDILVAVDQEGGRVQRLRDGFTRLPPMAVLGRRWATHANRAIAEAHELGWLMALELRQVDIDFSFAPVLDLDYGRSSVIGDRAFAAKAQGVTELAGAFMSGMHEAGMAATGKHFPGHGWVEADSHLAIPIDDRELASLDEADIVPFAALIRRGLDAIMPAHVIYSRACPAPAGFSDYWLREQLRHQLGFNGVIFSDDLSMEGASVAGDFPARCDRALAAGCDMVLVCNDRVAAQTVLDHLQANPVEVSPRLVRMQGKHPKPTDDDRLAAARELAVSLCREADA